MVFPILLASLQRTQLAMELSVISPTSQMNYVRLTAYYFNQNALNVTPIISLNVKYSKTSLIST